MFETNCSKCLVVGNHQTKKYTVFDEPKVSAHDPPPDKKTVLNALAQCFSTFSEVFKSVFSCGIHY